MSPTRYPRYDLGSAIAAAREFRSKSTDGATASPDELAAFLDYKSKQNGAFLSRLAAMRQFGLVEGRGEVLRLTDRALDILEPDYPATADRARLDAFFDIDLYKKFFDRYGQGELPDDRGMKNAMQNTFGLDEQQASQALSRLLDSAEEAGLFRVAGGRTKMIRPTVAGPAPTPNSTSETEDLPIQPATTLRTTGPRASKIIDGVLDLLPKESEWTEDDLRQWLTFFEQALRLYYGLPVQPGASTAG